MSIKATIQTKLSPLKNEKDFGVISATVNDTYALAGSDVETQKIAIDSIVKTLVATEKNVMRMAFSYIVQPLAATQSLDVQKQFVESILDVFPMLSVKSGKENPGHALATRLEVFVDGKPELETHLMRQSLASLATISSWSHDGAAELLGAARLFAIRNKVTAEYYDRLEETLPALAQANPDLTCVAVKRLMDDLKLTDRLDSAITRSVQVLPVLANTGPVAFENIVGYLTKAVEGKPNVRTSTLLNAGSAVAQTIATEDSVAARNFVCALRKLAGENPDVPAIYRDFAVTTRNPETNEQDLVFRANDGIITVTENNSSLVISAFRNAVAKKYAGDGANDIHKQGIVIFSEKAEAAMTAAPTLNDVFESNTYHGGKLKAPAYPVRS